MKLLVLGGTRFFGQLAVKQLIARGHDVTIATRGLAADDLGSTVKRIVLDREHIEDYEEVLQEEQYDVVFDNIAYCADDVTRLFNTLKGKIKRYILTSSLAVYQKGYHQEESEFDPWHHSIQSGGRQTISYAEGKRQCEAVCARCENLSWVALRFPVVVGKNDYTKRLAFYCEHVKENHPFWAAQWDTRMSFIIEEEAASSIVHAVEGDYVGPLNVASHGDLSVHEIIQMIEAYTHQKACCDESSDSVGPYSTFGEVTLSTRNADQLGIEVGNVIAHFQELIAFLCDERA